MDLHVQSVSAGYGGLTVLRDFTFDFSPPGCYALMGPSGAGKTTLLRVLAGLLPPAGGTIGDFAGIRCAVQFQEDRLLEHLTVLQNVALVSDHERAERWLCALGMEEKLHVLPSALSGGQKRRTALARALAFGGDVLLLDEPFTGLDEAIRAEAGRLIRAHFQHVIFSTHDQAEAELMNAEIIRIMDNSK